MIRINWFERALVKISNFLNRSENLRHRNLGISFQRIRFRIFGNYKYFERYYFDNQSQNGINFFKFYALIYNYLYGYRLNTPLILIKNRDS